MNTQRKSKHLKTNPTIVASSSEEVSSLEWEEIAMAQEEEDLICRMYKLVGFNSWEDSRKNSRRD
ncbi:Homeodomain-like superfamily protein [Arabidopsis thaliana]|uniref:Homeodomain-like superfamily protein n=1 Tax=Arabidopsis thaliana TaxID=3702 RepID=A0A1P8AQ06_ARATH|nr:Homeodomain-like superfamily protein [Arabidopsis thaliana]ANM58733.1 Homeodomain-like superfamily protein [Arabidopsis thaliana]|eukprot:NP_001321147.1 Homeodomain-like superfamily protein [Arabidopsis thaliana]